MTISRVVSGTFAVVIIVTAALTGVEGKEVLMLSLFLMLPLTFIWYGDEIGDYMGTVRGFQVTSPTPGCLVKFFGWLLLLSPFIFLAIDFIRR